MGKLFIVSFMHSLNRKRFEPVCPAVCPMCLALRTPWCDQGIASVLTESAVGSGGGGVGEGVSCCDKCKSRVTREGMGKRPEVFLEKVASQLDSERQ